MGDRISYIESVIQDSIKLPISLFKLTNISITTSIIDLSLIITIIINIIR